MASKLGALASFAKSVLTRPDGAPVADLGHVDLRRLDGTPLPPDVWQGKAVLFVNVASRCGLTPQYETLEGLQRTYGDRGFTVIGVPCNQFMGQEPGNAAEIATFCSTTYGVSFPLLEKADVNGAERSALYRFLVDSKAGGGDRISWNFEKFLVDRNGEVTHRFPPKTLPDDPAVVAAIEGALG
jgi:glutathione peroxidase